MGYHIKLFLGIFWVFITGIRDIFAKTYWDMGYWYPPKQASMLYRPEKCILTDREAGGR